MTDLFWFTFTVSLGFGLGTILSGRLKRKQRSWGEIWKSVADSTFHIIFFTLVLAVLHPAFK